MENSVVGWESASAGGQQLSLLRYPTNSNFLPTRDFIVDSAECSTFHLERETFAA
jgi:hypothetical protein